jgi:NADH:ubiquinone oxidoreductase subunit F (NADH-binding)/(2Fe-2S) ferredoxin
MAKKEILICAGTACISAGAEEIKAKFEEEFRKLNLTEDFECKTVISSTGCVGPCSLGPVAIVKADNTFYGQLKTEDVPKIVEQHLKQGQIVEELLTEEEGEKIENFKDIRFMKKQKRIALRNTGIIDPNKIEEYLERDGYQALKTVLNKMTPSEVIAEIKDSGLRGRGGAGFPTGLKWSFAQQNKSDQKYIICNADEGDPGAFMDRSILEGDPHSIIEAMTIAGYAIGADQGYVYVRAEYPLAVKNLKIAIRQAENTGLLGSNIYGSNFTFKLEVRVGAGAFVCGEETALIASIEGKRGQPSTKPPFPANSGLWGKPTIINNVETLANIVPIINNGSQWFSSIGTEKSKGTKVFAVAGDVKETGLVEVPMGTTLREIIFEIAGGIADGKEFKAAQIGGPSGGTIPSEHLDLKIDYESLAEIGAIVGSGGLVIMDQDNSMVDVARFFLDFTEDESCGKCTPCRVGTKRMLDILEKILAGQANSDDLVRLEKLAKVIQETSLCGLGQTAPNPVLSTLEFFRDEYEELITDAEEVK